MNRTGQRIIGYMRAPDTPAHMAAGRVALPWFLRTCYDPLVLDCVRDVGPISRADISCRTGLPRANSDGTIEAFLDDGLVCAGRAQRGDSPGRRPGTLVDSNAHVGEHIGVGLVTLVKMPSLWAQLPECGAPHVLRVPGLGPRSVRGKVIRQRPLVTRAITARCRDGSPRSFLDAGSKLLLR